MKNKSSQIQGAMLLVLSLILWGCGGGSTGDNPVAPEFSITSLSYADQADIPLKHACAGLGGQNISPQYAWSNIPDGTDKFAIIMDDEVSPCGVGANACKHWGVFNIPAANTELNESFIITQIQGVVEGINYTGGVDYDGPCPPNMHTYKTTVYALDAVMPVIPVSSSYTRSEFEAAYQTNIIDSATISGIFTP